MKKNIEKCYVIGSYPLERNLLGRLILKSNGRIEFVIVIDDKTTLDNLKEAWKVNIPLVRELLHQHQGTDFKNPKNVFIYLYAIMKSNGWTYKRIAQEINFEIISNLETAVEQLNNGDEPTFLDYAFLKLKSLRMKDEVINRWLENGMNDVREKRTPWTEDTGPVAWVRVREALRQFEKDIKSGKIVIKGNPEI